MRARFWRKTSFRNQAPSSTSGAARGAERQGHRDRADLRRGVRELGAPVLVLVEEAELRAEEGGGRERGLHAALERDVGAPRRDVDRSALLRRDDVVPVAPEELRGELHRHRARPLDAPEADAERGQRVAEHVGLDAGDVERPRADVDHAAESARPVEHRAAAGDNLHRADGQAGHRLPVDPPRRRGRSAASRPRAPALARPRRVPRLAGSGPGSRDRPPGSRSGGRCRRREPSGARRRAAARQIARGRFARAPSRRAGTSLRRRGARLAVTTVSPTRGPSGAPASAAVSLEAPPPGASFGTGHRGRPGNAAVGHADEVRTAVERELRQHVQGRSVRVRRDERDDDREAEAAHREWWRDAAMSRASFAGSPPRASRFPTTIPCGGSGSPEHLRGHVLQSTAPRHQGRLACG